MSLNKPVLDDRSYEQIRDELVARIPVYAPEWTDHNPSDPGIALIELFSYLTENLLYRFNQIPDSTKLEFLRLLQIPLRPAKAAKVMLELTTKLDNGQQVPQFHKASASEVNFSTQSEVRVLPVSAIGAMKIADDLPAQDSEEEAFFEQAKTAAKVEKAAPYHTETVWVDEPGLARNHDTSVDGILWLAVLAEKPQLVEARRQLLTQDPGGPTLLNVGFVPDVTIEQIEDTTTAEYAQRFRCPGYGLAKRGNPVNWQVSTGRIDQQGQPVYQPLQIAGDTSDGLEREGVVRLQFPAGEGQIGTFAIDDFNIAGTGEFPPVLDDEIETRIVCWLRAFRNDGQNFGKVLYVGVNNTQGEQWQESNAEFIGTGNAQPNQLYPLNHRQVIRNSVALEVEEPQGWTAWQEVESFQASNESDRHFLLDRQTGQIQFGTGINGQVPQIGQRIRVVSYRYGGGVRGNVAAKAVSKVSVPGVKVANPLKAYDGKDEETLEHALARIPAELRRRNRAVTQGDFKELALEAAGANIGRAEVLPLYHPQLPAQESAGVVSVVVWPEEDHQHPNAPMPDENQIHSVCQWLNARRLVTTELFVLPPSYVGIAIAVGVKVKDGFGIDAVRHWVELVLRQYLAPLPPYGPNGQGWPLGRRVHGPELEAAAHQVEGVEYLEGLQVVSVDAQGNVTENTIELNKNQVPELLSITVESGPITLTPGEMLSPDEPAQTPIPVPVIKEVC